MTRLTLKRTSASYLAAVVSCLSVIEGKGP
jgi:hypothetical protein